MNIFRSAIFHTPANPFTSNNALVSLEDGGVAFEDGRVLACSDYSTLLALYPDAEVRDLRDGAILPGFVDTHIHFPQVRIIGCLGYSLLDWLDQVTLPEEARLADAGYAAVLADEFVDSLAANGTTTSLVFGSHFPKATTALFDAAVRKGLRIVSGIVLSDRLLRGDLLVTPEEAYRSCRSLRAEIRGKPRLGYAVMPRFALSASEAMLEVCAALLSEDASLLFTTHINENIFEIEETKRVFPHAGDYLQAYESFDLISERAVLAHNVHTTDSQLERISQAGASIAHCPSSNAALGSGIFPMHRHLEHRVKFALGTDVGAGTGFGVAEEAVQSYLLQRVAPEPMVLTPAQMLYLATKAGAEALKMADSIGDFQPGKAADFVYVRPVRPPRESSWSLGEVLTQVDAASVKEVWIEGTMIHDNY